jgi:histidine triad (HIT) family protein
MSTRGRRGTPWSCRNGKSTICSTALKAVTHCARVVVLVVGYEVPHAHVHLIPTNTLGDVPFPPIDADAKGRLAETAARINGVIR